MRYRTFTLGISTFVIACQGSPPGGESGAPEAGGDWQAQLDLLSRPRGAVMAPAFVRAPEDGTLLRIALHSTEQACDRYSSSGEGNGDFWWVSVELGSPDAGDFAIGTNFDEELPRVQRRHAKVRLSEVRGWRRQRVYDAPEGTVTLDVAPADLAAWRTDGAIARGRVEAMFSLMPRRQVECSGEATATSPAAV